jgi:hypothetical protein
MIGGVSETKVFLPPMNPGTRPIFPAVSSRVVRTYSLPPWNNADDVS